VNALAGLPHDAQKREGKGVREGKCVRYLFLVGLASARCFLIRIAPPDSIPIPSQGGADIVVYVCATVIMALREWARKKLTADRAAQQGRDQMQILRYAALRSESVTFFNLAEKWH
jgi:hypothetical protein